MRSCAKLVVLTMWFALAACGATDPNEGVGGSQPYDEGHVGEPCSNYTECGRWTCICEGIEGAPGSAQLCLDGVCPSGEEACAIDCATVHAKVAVAVASCDD